MESASINRKKEELAKDKKRIKYIGILSVGSIVLAIFGILYGLIFEEITNENILMMILSTGLCALLYWAWRKEQKKYNKKIKEIKDQQEKIEAWWSGSP